MQHGQRAVDGGENFVGFFEEDAEQLGIEFFLAGIDKARGLGGRGRHVNRPRFRGRDVGRGCQPFDLEVRQGFGGGFADAARRFGQGFLGRRLRDRRCDDRRRGWLLDVGRAGRRRLEYGVDVGIAAL